MFVVFLMEMVYGLGVDVMRSGFVKGIFEVKGWLLDNFFIVYVLDLEMLRDLLSVFMEKILLESDDLILVKYKFLIERFWLGFLIILFLNL